MKRRRHGKKYISKKTLPQTGTNDFLKDYYMKYAKNSESKWSSFKNGPKT